MVNGYLVHRIVFVSYFSVLLCMLVFCTWTLADGLYTMYKPRPNSPLPTNPLQKEDLKLIRRNMILSVVSGGLFSLAMIVAYIATLMMYFHTGWDNTDHSDDNDAQSIVLVRIFTLICLVFDLSGYLCLFLFYYIRMRLTFIRSQYRLTDQWIRVLKGLLGLGLIALLVSVVLYLVLNERTISAIVGVFPVLIYSGLSVWIGFRFLYLTIQIAHNAPPGTTLNFLNVSLKMSIVTNTAILFSLLTGLIWLIRILTGDGYWIRQVFYYFFVTDPLLSMICCLLSFKDQTHYYRMVFGRLNDFLLNLLVGS